MGIFFTESHASDRLAATLAHERIETAIHRIPDEVDSTAMFSKADFDHDLNNIDEKA